MVGAKPSQAILEVLVPIECGHGIADSANIMLTQHQCMMRQSSLLELFICFV
jgi:hypothetical protein